jgi:hypothetical protein
LAVQGRRTATCASLDFSETSSIRAKSGRGRSLSRQASHAPLPPWLLHAVKIKIKIKIDIEIEVYIARKARETDFG